METLSLEQMENVNGGVNWCSVARGVAGVGSGLLICGAALSGGVATAAFAAICVYAAVC